MKVLAAVFLVALVCGSGWGQGPAAAGPAGAAIQQGRQALAAREFARANAIFAGAVRVMPDSVDALMGEGDAELGLRQYEAAELTYRRVTALQPETWLAHKNLVIVEAALGRWEEFDRERAFLHAARERGAKGISWHENEVIDAFDVGGARWIVRAYDEPAGKPGTRYNFEHFAASGRVLAYLSLEPLTEKSGPQETMYALDFYTGKAHGMIAQYPGAEPTYERVRADALRWLRKPVAK